MLSIVLAKGNAKESGREYDYVSLRQDGEEFNRIFIQKTEVSFYKSLEGKYNKIKDDVKQAVM